MVLPYEADMPKGGTRIYGGERTYGCLRGDRFFYMLKGKNYRVARLICEAFHGPRPLGLNCLHIDENPLNNRPSNLKWGTQKENLNAPGFIAYCKSRTGENNPNVKGRARKKLQTT